MGIFGIVLLTRNPRQGNLVFSRVSGGYSVALATSADRAALTSVTIPERVGSRPVVLIADRAFQDCANLRTVIIPNSVRRIGTEAFRNCTSLVSISIPQGVTRIDARAFYGCSSLAIVYVQRRAPDITRLGQGAFTGTALGAMFFADNASREAYTKDANWSGFVKPALPFVAPAADYTVVRNYTEAHRAMDLEVSAGTYVRAVLDGTVTVQSDAILGTIIEISHIGGITSRYSFQSGDVRVISDQSVARWEILGVVTRPVASDPEDELVVRFEMFMHGRAVNPAHFVDI
jgi:hypothetical protein